MEIFLFILKIVSGPVMGGLIGLFTNYIAIRMLFHPYKEVRIGKIRMPFTPGMVPKRQDEIAKAIGSAVSESLLTSGDIEAHFTSDGMKENIGVTVTEYLFSSGAVLAEIEGSDTFIETASDVIAKKMIEAAQESDVGGIVIEKAQEAARSGALGIVTKFVPQKMLEGVISPLGEKINEYIGGADGYGAARSAVKKELEKMAGKPLSENIKSLGADREGVKAAIINAYEGFFAQKLAEMASGIDVAAIIENNVKSMDVAELEKLVLSVTKKELKAIVLLGGLLGFIIGIVTSVIAVFM